MGLLRKCPKYNCGPNGDDNSYETEAFSYPLGLRPDCLAIVGNRNSVKFAPADRKGLTKPKTAGR